MELFSNKVPQSAADLAVIADDIYIDDGKIQCWSGEKSFDHFLARGLTVLKEVGKESNEALLLRAILTVMIDHATVKDHDVTWARNELGLQLLAHENKNRFEDFFAWFLLCCLILSGIFTIYTLAQGSKPSCSEVSREAADDLPSRSIYREGERLFHCPLLRPSWWNH